MFGQITNLVAALVATALSARLLEHRSLASVGYKLHRGWTGDFAFGSLIGASSIALAVGIEAAAGAVSFDVQTRDGWFLMRAFALLFFFFLIAGAIEELLFRGFAFQALVHNIGPFAAIAFTSILFGLAHIRNDNATAFSTINTMLAGVWLGVAYLMTRSLWLATALHYSWNLVMVFVFGLPVSGIKSFGHACMAQRAGWLYDVAVGRRLWAGGWRCRYDCFDHLDAYNLEERIVCAFRRDDRSDTTRQHRIKHRTAPRPVILAFLFRFC